MTNTPIANPLHKDAPKAAKTTKAAEATKAPEGKPEPAPERAVPQDAEPQKADWLPADAPAELHAFVGTRSATDVVKALMNATRLIGKKGQRPDAEADEAAWAAYHGVPENGAYDLPVPEGLDPPELAHLKTIFAKAYLSQDQAMRLVTGLSALIVAIDGDEDRAEAALQDYVGKVRAALASRWGDKALAMAEFAERGLSQLLGEQGADLAFLLSHPLEADTQADLVHGLAMLGQALADGGPAIPLGQTSAAHTGDPAQELRAFQADAESMAAYQRWEPWAVERVNALQNKIATRAA